VRQTRTNAEAWSFRRARGQRGIRLRLECGHEVVLPTGKKKVSLTRAKDLLVRHGREGVCCPICKKTLQVTRYLGTCPLDEKEGGRK